MLSKGNRGYDWPKRRTLARSVRTSRSRARPQKASRTNHRDLSSFGRKEKTPSEKTYGCHTAACTAIGDLKFLYRPVFPSVSTKLPLPPSLFQLPLKGIFSQPPHLLSELNQLFVGHV